MGITHHRNGVENVEAISNLALLRGMMGKRHAGLLPLRGHSNVQGIGSIGVKPVLPDEVFSSIEKHFGVNLPKDRGLDTLACIQAACDGDIDCALIMGGNLYEATPHSSWARKALDRIDFKCFLTTTLNRGHVHGLDKSEAIILPVTARDEEPQATTQESMFNYVRLSEGGIRRLQNPRSEVSILSELGQRILPDSALDFRAFTSHKQIRYAIAETIPGMEELADIDVARREFHVNGRLLHKPEFKTSDGKAAFICHEFPDTVPISTEYPFVLGSVRSEGQFNSIIYEQEDRYRGNAHRQVLMINRDDMLAMNLKEGDRVGLRSPQGALDGLELKVYDLPRGNLMAYYPEANALIGTETDPRSRTPAFKSVPVAIDGTSAVPPIN